MLQIPPLVNEIVSFSTIQSDTSCSFSDISSTPESLEPPQPIVKTLSNDFIHAFHEEFKKQTASTIVENEDGTQTESAGRNRHTVLREFQKALKFLSKGN